VSGEVHAHLFPGLAPGRVDDCLAAVQVPCRDTVLPIAIARV